MASIDFPKAATVTAPTVTASYQVLASDATVVIDSSGWTSGDPAIALSLPPSPVPGERHAFIEDGFVIGRPSWTVSGNGNPIAPYEQDGQVSKPRAPGGVTSVPDLGASFAVVWSQDEGAWLQD